MPCYDNFWHTDALQNITSPGCFIVFVKSKTENQLMRFVIAHLVADNNVKRETVAAMREHRTHYSAPPNSPDLNPVDYRIWEYCRNIFIGNLLKTER